MKDNARPKQDLYGAGYETGYQQALDDVIHHLQSLRDQARASLRNVEADGPFAATRGLQAGWGLQADLAGGMANYLESFRGQRLPR